MHMTGSETLVPSIRYEGEAGVARLIIDHRSKMNAMTFEMWSSLPALIERAVADEEVRVIAIRGAGDQAFCAGADISQFGEKRSGASDVETYNHAVAAGNAALAGAPKPTVAVISGICFGGGFGLAMCCDLRIASRNSRFRIPAARLGLGYGYSNVDLLVRKLGVGPAADLLLSARVIGADEAGRLGVVNSVFANETFEDEGSAYLGRIASNAPLTLGAIKGALVQLLRPEAERDIGTVDALAAACFESADYREGQAAFREKRNPVFIGR
jgi:enoyl-CoA hydratase/carnithine racemase